MMKKIIRLETIRVIDNIKLLGFDYVENPNSGRIYPKPENIGIASRASVIEEHNELFLILFNKWRILIKKITK